MSDIKEHLKNRILILDGAMGTMLHQLNLSEEEYRGTLLKNSNKTLKGNNELLSLTKPELIESIHRAYLEAGADIIETNTFNSNSIFQSEYGLKDYVSKMNHSSVKLAKKLAKEYSTASKPRFVAGSIGPTNKSLSIKKASDNKLTFNDMVKCYIEQAEILINEDVDIILIETIFDMQNGKAALIAIEETLKKHNKNIPIMISATIRNNHGILYSGESLEEFYHNIKSSNPITFGLNCSLKIDEMIPQIENLSKYVTCGISAYAIANSPNDNSDTTPEEMAKGYETLAKKGILNICGGCCGTTPEHIKIISETLKNYQPQKIIL